MNLWRIIRPVTVSVRSHHWFTPLRPFMRCVFVSYSQTRRNGNFLSSDLATDFHLHNSFGSCSTATRSFFTNSHLNTLHSRNCWKCGQDTNPKRELFFCECGVVQRPAKEVTFYDLLQIQQSFDIDVLELSRRFKATQRRLHPDNFSTKSEEEQEYSEQQSSLLNKSYETLLKPLNRAIYLLELENITISENDSLTDPEFLMNMMDDFETVDNAHSSEEVESLEKTNDSRIDECIKELSKAFSQSDSVNAKNLTIRLRYFTTIQERIKELRSKGFGQ